MDKKQAGSGTIGPSIKGTIAKAETKTAGYDFVFSKGSLSQLGSQFEALEGMGIAVGNSDVHPAVKTEAEYIRGLRYFFNFRVDGWWNYHNELINWQICSEEEYQQAWENHCKAHPG